MGSEEVGVLEVSFVETRELVRPRSRFRDGFRLGWRREILVDVSCCALEDGDLLNERLESLSVGGVPRVIS